MPVPPQGAREEARRGLEWRAEYNRGGTMVGVARARDLANGANVSDETIGRMVSYFARHEVDKQGRGWSPGEPGFPSPGRIAWALWGGDAGRRWAESEYARITKHAHAAATISERHDSVAIPATIGIRMSDDTTRKPGRLRKLRITRVDRVTAGANPDAHVLLFKRADGEDAAVTTADVLDYPLAEPSVDERRPPEESNDMTAPDTDIVEKATEADDAPVADIVTDAAPADDAVESHDEDVIKAADPAVRERIAKAEADLAAATERIAKMEDEASTREFVAKAAEFKTVDADATRLGALLKDVAKNCSSDSVDALNDVLKSATNRLAEATRLITAEIGSAAGMDATDAGQKIEALAKARVAETGESMPVATAAILNANPDLYEQARAERA